MRNLKKFLALVLAMMMVMSLMVTVNAASSFPDANKIAGTYKTAVDVLSTVGVLKGDPESEGGNFRPTDPVRRVEMAKIIYAIKTGDTELEDKSLALYEEGCEFTDIAGVADWGIGVIGYASTHGLVRGNGDGTFAPLAPVTVVDALTMLLRALGYDKGGELAGPMYKVNALGIAQDENLLDNIPDGINTKAATREVVAQLTYNIIQAETVTGYTATTGTYTLGGASLATSVLKMVKEETVADEWGNPIAGGWLYNGKTVAEAPVELLLTKENEVSECDIWDKKELDGDIVAYYVDGIKQNITDDEEDDYNPVFSNGVSKHTTVLEDHPTYTTGGPGVITKAYYVDGGYWIAQIHVWLAKVTKVNPATTDENGHPTGITYDVDIYVDYDKNEDSDDTRNVTIEAKGCPAEDETDEFKVDDYVLVHVSLPVYDGGVLKSTKSNGFVTVAGVAPVVAIGEIDDIYDQKIVVDGDEIDESLNYYLNREVYVEDASWRFFGDGMGNIIGQVQGSDKYAVIERIEWKHHTTEVGKGYALADLLLSDGTHKTGVKITGTTNRGDDGNNVGPASGRVADDYTSNSPWYGHIFLYEETATDTFALIEIGSDDYNLTAQIKKGNARISVATKVNPTAGFFTADDDTLFFVWSSNKYSYELCEGIDNLSSTSATNWLCIVADENSYAKAVVIRPYTAPASNTYPLYFIEEGTPVTQSGNKYYANLYPVGSAKTTRVQVSSDLVDNTDPDNLVLAASHSVTASGGATTTNYDVTGTGLYRATVSPSGVITDLDAVTNGNFYNVEDSATPGSGEMLEEGASAGTNRYVGTFFGDIRYEIFSLQAKSDSSSETFASGTKGEDAGLDNGAKGMISVNEKVKNGYTVVGATGLYDFYDFRLTDATVVKINLHAVGSVLNGDFDLEAGTQTDLTSDSLFLLVYDVNTSTNEHDVKYAYVYKVVQVEGTATTDTLTISSDKGVGNPYIGVQTPEADGSYTFYVTVNNGEKVAVEAGNCNALITPYESSNNMDTYKVSVTDITGSAYVHVYGDSNASAIGVAKITKAGNDAYDGTNYGGAAFTNTDLTNLYDKLGITVDATDAQNVTITIKSATFNKADVGDQLRLVSGNLMSGSTNGVVKGTKGYAGFTMNASSNIAADSFCVDGVLHSEASTSNAEDVYITIAKWNGSRMILEPSATHLVRFVSSGTSYTVTVNVIVK